MILQELKIKYSHKILKNETSENQSLCGSEIPRVYYMNLGGVKMPLISCPDCKKQMSDRVEACPFCGCPAKFFPTLQEDVDASSHQPEIEEINKKTEMKNTEDETEEKIVFSFGSFKVEYPKSTEKIAKLYGKYVAVSNEFYDKYYSMYASAGSMNCVLTDLTQKVIQDVQQTVDEACEDLYILGIKITKESFIKKYRINFKSEISDLYDQYDNIQQEKEEISYKREVEKASRGRWQGGGFGMKGAIKGAVNAAVLNAGSDVLHSIGDGITKRGDTRYINGKLIQLYHSSENQNVFANGVYRCIDNILEGIKKEMAEADIIDICIFGNYGEINSNYKTIVKYEKNRSKLFEGMIQCFSHVPEIVRYYEPVINELFELDTDIESFLKFWGLSSLYESLKSKYEEKIIQDIKNPFVRNIADIGIEILDKPSIGNNGVVVNGRVVKGRVHVGDLIVFLNNGCNVGFSAMISSIQEGDKECSLTKIGREYKFMLPAENTVKFENCSMLVDGSCFKKSEADLYARYYKDGKEIVWGFDEYCAEKGDHILFCFDAADKYVSCRGVDFSYNATRVIGVYGNANEQIYDGNNDVTLLCARKYNWESVLTVLGSAAFSISYSLGEQYILRYYFNDKQAMLLAVYMKNVDTSKEANRVELKPEFTQIPLQMECKKCGKLFKSTAKFCSYCGEPNPLFMKECPVCGRQIKWDAKFCNFCGEKIVCE